MQHLLVITGILTRASEAKEKTEEAQEKEGLELAVTSSQMEDVNTLEITEEKLSDAIKQQFGNNKNFSITDNEDGSFLVSMNDTQRMYYIDETGKIIDQSKMLKISTADELKAFRDNVNSGNKYEGWYVYLTSDITLDINEEWEPIGYYVQNSEDTSIKDSIYSENNKPFSGIFNGQGHTVDYVNISNSKNGQGLFGLVANGQIKNINLGENCSINMEGIGCGGIVGIVLNTGTIYNCNNYTDIEQTRGGVVGVVIGSVTISNCCNYGDLNNASGGIVGSSNGTEWEEFADVYHTIINCANYGNVSKDSNTNMIGGIVGYFKGTISNCFNNGEINATGSAVGGIAGSITGKIQNCYNTKMVKGFYVVGGIVGDLERHIHNLLENCYNIGTVTGQNENVGELFGRNTNNMSEIINSYTSSDTFSAENLGSAFKEDTNSINDGYPILQWQ